MKLVILLRKPPQWNPGFPSNLTKYYLYKDIILKKAEIFKLTGRFGI